MQNIERFFEKFYELFPGSFPLLSQAVRFVMETPHREIMNLAMGNFGFCLKNEEILQAKRKEVSAAGNFTYT